MINNLYKELINYIIIIIISQMAPDRKDDKIIDENFKEELYYKDYIGMKDKVIIVSTINQVEIINNKIIKRYNFILF